MWGAPFAKFPLGLGGMMDETKTLKTVEDWVTEIMDTHDDGELALMYEALYHRGFRIDNVAFQIRKLKERLG